MKAALAQIAPVLFDREATLARVIEASNRAADGGAQLVVFGEGLVPGYPVWLDRGRGAEFDSPRNKRWHAAYLESAVVPELGHLDELKQLAADRGLTVVLGTLERAQDRGGQSLYCSAMTIGSTGDLLSVHRKLMPTYEERLSWSPGDGNGLVVHDLDEFRLGSLNCWENWMPLARAALYAQGETLHCAIWPGNERNTRDLTPVLAKEGRSFVLSVSGILRAEDVPSDFPLREELGLSDGEWLLGGGSCACAPDGSFLLEPVTGREAVEIVDLDIARVREERQNFDPSGHYSRPDVFELQVDRRRQGLVTFRD